jgi:hypothetical protein
MQTQPIVRARQGSDLLLGGAGAREFARLEFPREDYHWVVANVCRVPPTPSGGGLRARLAKALRVFGTSEVETDPEAATERALA